MNKTTKLTLVNLTKDNIKLSRRRRSNHSNLITTKKQEDNNNVINEKIDEKKKCSGGSSQQNNKKNNRFWPIKKKFFSSTTILFIKNEENLEKIEKMGKVEDEKEEEEMRRVEEKEDDKDEEDEEEEEREEVDEEKEEEEDEEEEGEEKEGGEEEEEDDNEGDEKGEENEDDEEEDAEENEVTNNATKIEEEATHLQIKEVEGRRRQKFSFGHYINALLFFFFFFSLPCFNLFLRPFSSNKARTTTTINIAVAIGRLFDTANAFLGDFIARHPIRHIFASVCFLLVLSLQLINMDIEYDIRASFSPLNSKSMREASIYKEFFNLSTSPQRAFMLFKAKDGGTMLREEHLREVLQLDAELDSTLSLRDGKTGMRGCDPLCNLNRPFHLIAVGFFY